MFLTADPLGVSHTGLLWPAVVSNVAICIGYVVVSGSLTFGRFSRIFGSRVTRIAGALFFVTCGLHHLMNVIDLALSPHMTMQMSLQTPMMVGIDVIQAVAVWVFALSVARELQVLIEGRSR